MCGNTVVILGKYEVGCVCWRDCPTQVAICSNPCLPWHSLTPSDPRIPPLFPEKNPWNAPQFPLSLSTPTNPSYPLFPRQYCSQKQNWVFTSVQSGRAHGPAACASLCAILRRVCIPRAGSRPASLAHTGHGGQGASLDFRNAKHSPCVRAGTQLCYANFKLWVKNFLAQISLSTRPLAQICPYIEPGIYSKG